MPHLYNCGPALRALSVSMAVCATQVLRKVALHLRVTAGAAGKRFSLHSLRSGGATTEMEQRVSQAHGGWATPTARHANIQEAMEKRMAPTAAWLQGYH